MNVGMNPFASKPVNLGDRMMQAAAGGGSSTPAKPTGDNLLQRLAQLDAGQKAQRPAGPGVTPASQPLNDLAASFAGARFSQLG